MRCAITRALSLRLTATLSQHVWSRHKRQPVRLSANPTIGFRFSKRFINNEQGGRFHRHNYDKSTKAHHPASERARDFNQRYRRGSCRGIVEELALPGDSHKEFWQDGWSLLQRRAAE